MGLPPHHSTETIFVRVTSSLHEAEPNGQPLHCSHHTQFVHSICHSWLTLSSWNILFTWLSGHQKCSLLCYLSYLKIGKMDIPILVCSSSFRSLSNFYMLEGSRFFFKSTSLCSFSVWSHSISQLWSIFNLRIMSKLMYVRLLLPPYFHLNSLFNSYPWVSHGNLQFKKDKCEPVLGSSVG